MNSPPDSFFLRFLAESHVHLSEARDADKALKVALRIGREVFRADEICIAVHQRGENWANVKQSVPGGANWKGLPFIEFLSGKRPRLTPTILMVAIERRGEPWGILCLRNRTREFSRDAFRDAARIGPVLSYQLRRIDLLRIADVRAKIDRKMMEQLRPKDLCYQILHGIRSLTNYDHSAAVLLFEPPNTLEVVAEQIAWGKHKSEAVGTVIELTEEARGFFDVGEVYGFVRDGRGWHNWRGRAAAALSGLLEFKIAGERKEERSVLCAPLSRRGELLGVLKIASRHSSGFGTYEVNLVKRFLPQASIVLRNLRRTTSFETGLLEAEKKQVLATLARGVTHDVNNAFGATLPIVQQMISDLQSDRMDKSVFIQDLEQIEQSLKVCRRIFGHLVGFARHESGALGEGDVQRAIDSTLAVLDKSMKLSGVEVSTSLEDEVPLVRGTQADLEQLFLNLAGNARDAMPDGGELSIEVCNNDGELVLVIADTGTGIPEEDLQRVKEPFFTTKADGNGLGLSICRSIAWKMQGRLAIESQQGEGTRVTVRLPQFESEAESVPQPESI